MTSKIGSVPALLFSFLAVACTHDPSPSHTMPGRRSASTVGNENSAVLGSTLVRVRDPSENAFARSYHDLRAYGRLEFGVEFLEPGFRREVRPNDGSAVARLWRALQREVSPSVRHIALTVTPEVDGRKLGEFVLFSIDVVDRNSREGAVGPQLTSTISEQTAAPWVRLENGTAVSYQISVRATTATGVDIKRELGQVTSILSAIGAGPTSGLSTVVGFVTLPIVGQVADRASSVLNGAYSSNIQSTARATLGPGNTSNADPDRFWREDRIVLRSENGQDLAMLRVDLVMASTLVSPERSRTTPERNAALRPTPNSILSVLRIPAANSTNLPLLSDRFRDHPPLERLDGEARRNPPDPAAFATTCIQAQNYAVGSLGLTPFDALRVRYELSELAGYTNSPTLQSSGCFSTDDLEALRQMGIRPDRSTAARREGDLLSDATLQNLAQIMHGTRGSTDQFNRQLGAMVSVTAPAGAFGAEPVVLTGDAAVDRGDVVSRFLRGRASTVGCFGNPGGEAGRPQALDRRLIFAPSDPRVVPMTLTLLVSEDRRSVVGLQVSPASEATIVGACGRSSEMRDRFLAALRAASDVPIASR